MLSVERALKRQAALKRNSLEAIGESMWTPFTLDNFKIPPQVERWVNNWFQPTLILVGSSGCGKTQFVKAMGMAYDWRMLTLNHTEGLKGISEVYNAVFWDDVSMERVDPPTFLSMLETSERKTIQLLHGTFDKPKGLIQIFAFNKMAFKDLIWMLKKPEYARRCVIVIVPENFKKNNINIVNNYHISAHTHIYNNPETIAANAEALSEISKSIE